MVDNNELINYENEINELAYKLFSPGAKKIAKTEIMKKIAFFYLEFLVGYAEYFEGHDMYFIIARGIEAVNKANGKYSVSLNIPYTTYIKNAIEEYVIQKLDEENKRVASLILREESDVLLIFSHYGDKACALLDKNLTRTKVEKKSRLLLKKSEQLIKEEKRKITTTNLFHLFSKRTKEQYDTLSSKN